MLYYGPRNISTPMVNADHLAELIYKAHRQYRSNRNGISIDLLPTWLDLQTLSRSQLVIICQMVIDELEYEEDIKTRKPWK